MLDSCVLLSYFVALTLTDTDLRPWLSCPPRSPSPPSWPPQTSPLQGERAIQSGTGGGICDRPGHWASGGFGQTHGRTFVHHRVVEEAAGRVLHSQAVPQREVVDGEQVVLVGRSQELPAVPEMFY